MSTWTWTWLFAFNGMVLLFRLQQRLKGAAMRLPATETSGNLKPAVWRRLLHECISIGTSAWADFKEPRCFGFLAVPGVTSEMCGVWGSWQLRCYVPIGRLKRSYQASALRLRASSKVTLRHFKLGMLPSQHLRLQPQQPGKR